MTHLHDARPIAMNSLPLMRFLGQPTDKEEDFDELALLDEKLKQLPKIFFNNLTRPVVNAQTNERKTP